MPSSISLHIKILRLRMEDDELDSRFGIGDLSISRLRKVAVDVPPIQHALKLYDAQLFVDADSHAEVAEPHLVVLLGAGHLYHDRQRERILGLRQCREGELFDSLANLSGKLHEIPQKLRAVLDAPRLGLSLSS